LEEPDDLGLERMNLALRGRALVTVGAEAFSWKEFGSSWSNYRIESLGDANEWDQKRCGLLWIQKKCCETNYKSSFVWSFLQEQRRALKDGQDDGYKTWHNPDHDPFVKCSCTIDHDFCTLFVKCISTIGKSFCVTNLRGYLDTPHFFLVYTKTKDRNRKLPNLDTDCFISVNDRTLRRRTRQTW
jgi:hypothetical protein